MVISRSPQEPLAGTAAVVDPAGGSAPRCLTAPEPSGRAHPAAGDAPVDVSVVIPIFNEAENIPHLHERLARMLDGLGRPAEVWYVDDGSTDQSLERLQAAADEDPRVGVIELGHNCGQHAAVLAGFAASRGAIVVTLDGDLQNPPEEIPRLVAKLEEGHDVVGGWRESRSDPLARRLLSALVNHVTSVAVGVRMRDYGCMLRSYRRDIVDQILQHDERSLFIPALANTLAKRPVEIEVRHAEREAGASKYRPLKLLRLGFDLLTGYSLLPIQLVSVAGILVSVAGLAFGLFLILRRLIIGPEVEGVFTLFAILFVFLGVLILAVGLVGEYVGRIYLEVRRRPVYTVKTTRPPSRSMR